MNLHMLTRSGWIWLAVTFAATACVVVEVILVAPGAQPRGDKDAKEESTLRNHLSDAAILCALMITWLLWLVTP